MSAALIMSGRSEPALRRGLEFDAFQKSVKREIEIEPRLFAIGDDVESGLQLVVNRGEDGVVVEFFAVCLAEPVKVLAGKLQPARKRITADDGGSEQGWWHEVGDMRYEDQEEPFRLLWIIELKIAIGSSASCNKSSSFVGFTVSFRSKDSCKNNFGF